MIIIKGLIIFEEENFINRIKSKLGIFRHNIESYNEKSILCIKTGTECNVKKIRAFLGKNSIREAACVPESEENISFIRSIGVIPVCEKQLMKNIISDIVKKSAQSDGIKKGILSVGIASESSSGEILTKLIGMGEYLSEIYIFGEKSNCSIKEADEFFEETGVSVIISEEIKGKHCDILICCDSDVQIPIGCAKKIISLDEKIYPIKSVNGIRTKLPKEVKKEKVSDLVLAYLYDINVKITKLIVRS